MEYEGSFMIMKLVWHSYLIFSLDNNCAHKISTEIGLSPPPAVIADSDDFGSRHDSSNVLECVFGRREALSPVDGTNASVAKGILSFLSPSHHSKLAIS